MGYNAVIGRNVIICQRVTIEQGAPVYIGDNVKIGANAVVVEDIPSNSTVVMPKPRVIIRSNK